MGIGREGRRREARKVRVVLCSPTREDTEHHLYAMGEEGEEEEREVKRRAYKAGVPRIAFRQQWGWRVVNPA